MEIRTQAGIIIPSSASVEQITRGPQSIAWSITFEGAKPQPDRRVVIKTDRKGI